MHDIYTPALFPSYFLPQRGTQISTNNHHPTVSSCPLQGIPSEIKKNHTKKLRNKVEESCFSSISLTSVIPSLSCLVGIKPLPSFPLLLDPAATALLRLPVLC